MSLPAIGHPDPYIVVLTGLGLLIASPLGMAVGALVETWSKQWGARA